MTVAPKKKPSDAVKKSAAVSSSSPQSKAAAAAAAAAAATPKGKGKKNILSQLVPIPGLGSFTWTQYKTLANSRDAELAPSLPAFLVTADTVDEHRYRDEQAAAAAALPAMSRRGFVPKTADQILKGISPAIISTQTKIVMLSADIDVNALFWHLPLIRYEEPRAGILKKQIQIQSSTPEEVQAYLVQRAGIDRFFTELVTADTKNCNVNARKVSFVDERIPFVGIVSKDLVSSQSKVKGTFIHCTTLNVRAWNAAVVRWCEVHLKIFNTGKIIIPGIVVGAIDMFLHVLALVLQLLNDALQEVQPGAAPLYIRHDLTASSGNHFGDPHGLLPPSSSILADNLATANGNSSSSSTTKRKRGEDDDDTMMPKKELKEEAAAAASAPSLYDAAVQRPLDAFKCPEGCPGLMMVGDNGLPVCGACGTFMPFSIDHGPDWKNTGGGEHDMRGKEVPRCGNAVNPNMIESSFAYRLTPAAAGGGGGHATRNVAKWMSWLGGGQSEKSNGDEIQLLRRVGNVAGLPRTVVATAEQLLYRLRGHPASRGLTKPMRRIRNIWLASQAHGCPRTVPEMAALFRVDLHTATRSCSLNFEDLVESLEKPLSGQRNLYFGPVLPGHFLHRFANRLGLHGVVADISMFVATVVARHDVVPGARPHAIAAGSLYYVSLCCGIVQTKKQTWLLLDKEISEVGLQRIFTKLCFYKLFPAALRSQYPQADAVEHKCLSSQRLLEASAAAALIAAAEDDEEEKPAIAAAGGGGAGYRLRAVVPEEIVVL